MVDDDNYRSADNKQRNDSNNLINNVAANDDNSLKYNTRYHDDINIITRKFNDNSSFNINDDYSKFITASFCIMFTWNF